MSPSPLVSILIPCHNAAGWLEAGIRSVLQQTYPNIEVLVHDDGSTDGSGAVLRSFGQQVAFSGGPNRGGNHARNLLLERSRGEFVQFLDADDYLMPDKIARQLKETPRPGNVDVIYSPVLTEVWSDGRPAAPIPSQVDVATDLFTQWISWQLPQTGGALWRRESLLRVGGWKDDQPCCQEHELYLRAIQAELRFHFCPTPGAVYRIWSESTVCRRDPLLVIRERTRLIDSALEWLMKKGWLQHHHERAAAQAFFEMARTWAKYHPRDAANFARECRRRGLFRPAGPAAPLLYRICLRAFGFSLSERIAEAGRRKKPAPAGIPTP